MTASGGANAVNSSTGDVAVASSAAAAHATMPSVIKAKPGTEKLKTAAAVAKKRGLKRL